jgi:hypothetical protein
VTWLKRQARSYFHIMYYYNLLCAFGHL